MELDEDVCLCFHVTRRKLENFLRLHQPSRVSQLSQCEGAGTGCGWCVRVLEQLFAHHQQQDAQAPELPTLSQHTARRSDYLDASQEKD